MEVELRQDVLNAHRLDVASAVRIQLDGGNLQRCNLFRVNLAGDVAFNHADRERSPQPCNQFRDQASLSGAGASHHIDQADLFFGQGFADLSTHILVPLHHLVQYFDFHFQSTSKLSTMNSFPERRLSWILPQNGHWMRSRVISLSRPQSRQSTFKGTVSTSILAPSARVPFARTSKYI